MNYYEILGVSEGATQEEIKKAYNLLIKKYHPDITTLPKKEAEEKMKLINQAYSILSDQNLRKKYDYELKYGESFSENNYSRNNQSSQYYEDFVYSSNSERGERGFFEEIFSNLFGGGQNRTKRENVQKTNLSSVLKIEEVYYEKTKTIYFKNEDKISFTCSKDLKEGVSYSIKSQKGQSVFLDLSLEKSLKINNQLSLTREGSSLILNYILFYEDLLKKEIIINFFNETIKINLTFPITFPYIITIPNKGFLNSSIYKTRSNLKVNLSLTIKKL